MDPKILKRRITSIKSRLKKDSFSGIILTSKSNVSYVTGFAGDDSWALILGSRVWLITDSRYSEQASQECPSCKIIERSGSLSCAVGKLIGSHKNITKLAIEQNIPAHEFDALKKELRKVSKIKTVLVAEQLAQVREIKSDYEIDAIKKAARISKKALGLALAQISVGMTESKLAGLIEYEMRKLGSTPSFDTIVAFGANGSRPHHIPSKLKLKKNDTILVDYGSKFQGYCSDMTRCFAVGKISKEYAQAYEVVALAQSEAINAVRAGVKICDIDAASRSQIANTNFPQYGHGTGHGIGLDVHESPTVSSRNKTNLKTGAVITIEPGIYVPNKFGIRIEDDVLVTKTDATILTRGKKTPQLEVLSF